MRTTARAWYHAPTARIVSLRSRVQPLSVYFGYRIQHFSGFFIPALPCCSPPAVAPPLRPHPPESSVFGWLLHFAFLPRRLRVCNAIISALHSSHPQSFQSSLFFLPEHLDDLID